MPEQRGVNGICWHVHRWASHQAEPEEDLDITEAVEVKPHNISQEDSPEADDDGWNILEEVVGMTIN